MVHRYCTSSLRWCPNVLVEAVSYSSKLQPSIIGSFDYFKHSEEMHHIARQNVAHKPIQIDHLSTDTVIAKPTGTRHHQPADFLLLLLRLVRLLERYRYTR